MIVSVTLSEADLRLAARQAGLAALGGTSQLRSRDDRAASLNDDQLIGQLGQLALHRYWFGDVSRYVLGRYFQNRHPWEGDLGEDIPAANVDVKCSRMRRSPDPLSYNLCVRPRERHAGWVYVLALLPQGNDREVLLVGWAADRELPDEPEASGPLAGTYRLSAEALHPLPPVRYDYWRALDGAQEVRA